MKKRVTSEKLEPRKKLRLELETLRSLKDAETEAAIGATGGACETHWPTCRCNEA